jgi:ribosome biogenesis GTPase / thiamine phosphate phosphatase
MTGLDDNPEGVVLSGTGGVWRVHAGRRGVVEASLRGRLKKSRDQPGEEPTGLKLAVGDRVRLESGDRGDWAIVEILPRRSKLARRAPGNAYGERVLAANVDQVIVMFAAVKPEPHPRMLDRFLVIAEANELPSRIVINKIDLAADVDATRRMFAPYEEAGYPVHYVSVKGHTGLEAVHDAFAGRVSVLTGPSGVGKSSLLNTTFPGANLRVGEISESVQKGRHTTVGAIMLELPGDAGGFVVDTPGLREVGLWSVDADRLDSYFPEFRGHLAECRFGDCVHVREPDCGVLGAVARGEISAARYESYLLLLTDVRA